MLDLTGNWQLRDEHGEYAVPFILPGDGITALHDAGEIPDPYRGRNEYDLRWIADRDWIATRTFDITDDRPHWTVYADGLDCVAEIRINGALVLDAANAFRPHEADITGHVRRGRNDIAITFRSNTRTANARQAAQPFRVPYQDANSPIPNGNMLRKQQCDFGWDWNIALAPFGLYGAIGIRGDNPSELAPLRISQTHSPGAVTVHVAGQLLGYDHATIPIEISLAGQTKRMEVNVAPGVREPFATDIEIKDPVLWWPGGLGEIVHTDVIRIVYGNHTQTVQIAYRDIRLESVPDKAGRSFGFTVNGRPIFAKGANWIPADALAGRIDRKAVEDLLQSAADANMNMIRVWGGGRYEPDWFYEKCTELGLLVWQDAMLSCNLYPADDPFLTDIYAEIEHQAIRLAHHVALWCGDNELIGALTWFPESVDNRDRYLVAYDRLNRTVEAAVRSADPTANWWPSSPSPGPMSFGDAWHDDTSGDMHFWSVWHEGRDFEHYRDITPRFCSEFGFQSYTSMNVIKEFAGGDDLNIASPVMESHQKNAGGNARIAETMFRYFRFPEGFENFVYLSQIQQAVAIKTAVDYWRSLRPHCMGALYWQLNDTWPVASWSSLNYGGSWKALHYVARRFFAPVSVALIPKGEEVRVVAMNDTSAPIDASIVVTERDLSGKVLSQKALPVSIAADGVSAQNCPAGFSTDQSILTADLVHDNAVLASDTATACRFKSLNLITPEIALTAQVSDRVISIRLTCGAPAFFVTLSTDVPGCFSDNVLTLFPAAPVDITFHPDDPAHVQDAIQSLEINDLWAATYRAPAEASP